MPTRPGETEQLFNVTNAFTELCSPRFQINPTMGAWQLCSSLGPLGEPLVSQESYSTQSAPLLKEVLLFSFFILKIICRLAGSR